MTFRIPALALFGCLALMLAGCVTTGDGSRVKTGEEVQPPAGFVEWCAREPWQKACGGAGVSR